MPFHSLRLRFSQDYARVFPFDRVRLTSIYSKEDGVVHWQCQVIPHADCVEVTGSHVGLIFIRKAYRAVASLIRYEVVYYSVLRPKLADLVKQFVKAGSQVTGRCF